MTPQAFPTIPALWFLPTLRHVLDLEGPDDLDEGIRFPVNSTTLGAETIACDVLKAASIEPDDPEGPDLAADAIQAAAMREGGAGNFLTAYLLESIAAAILGAEYPEWQG